MCQARNQKFAMGGLGVWGQSPQPPEAQGFGGGAPSARKFCIFCKYNLILELLKKNNAFKTWHRNCQRNMIQLVALSGYVGSG